MNNRRAAQKIYAKSIDYKRTFGTDSGKRVLQDLMNRGHMLEPSYTVNDAHETAFREGERNLVLSILSELKYDLSRLKAHIDSMEDEND